MERYRRACDAYYLSNVLWKLERPARTQIASRPWLDRQIYLLLYGRDQFCDGHLESEHGGVHGHPADEFAGRRRCNFRQLFRIHIRYILRTTENYEDHDSGCHLSQHNAIG